MYYVVKCRFSLTKEILCDILSLKRVFFSIKIESGETMKIMLNPDEETVKIVKEGLKRTGGYCPCRRERTEDTKCMCSDFRKQIEDSDFEGYCHCMLYYKSLGEEKNV